MQEHASITARLNAPSDSTTDVIAAITAVRTGTPLVQCLINAVVSNITANALLAAGATPAMCDTPAESYDFARIATGVLVNGGAPSAEQYEGMRRAIAGANDAGTPWVLDPVAAGALTALPFIRQLADGTLSAEDFTFYQDQDALYLREYSRALALLSAKAPSSEQQVFWAHGAAECITVESLLHGDWLGADYVSAGPSPVTRAYTDFLTAAAGVQDYAIAAAAVLPCYSLYAEIGELLAAANRPDHPYTAWLSMYGSADFRASVEQALAYIEAALEVASPQVRSLATQAYQQASAHELHFFDQAHRSTLSV